MKKKPELTPYLELSKNLPPKVAAEYPALAKFLSMAHYAQNRFMVQSIDADHLRAAMADAARYIAKDLERRAKLGRKANPDASPATVARRERWRRAKEREGRKK